jgi:menaquinone reductase, multiheme cytochrome c subunit
LPFQRGKRPPRRRPPHRDLPDHNIVRSGAHTGTAEIQKIHDAHGKGLPIQWVRIHKLPDFAYFDHSAHVNKGVSCVECHGRIDQMDEVRAAQPLSMSWCLDCHRNPAPHLRDRNLITNLAWKPEGDPAELGREFMKKYNVQPRTDCSTCHR